MEESKTYAMPPIELYGLFIMIVQGPRPLTTPGASHRIRDPQGLRLHPPKSTMSAKSKSPEKDDLERIERGRRSSASSVESVEETTPPVDTAPVPAIVGEGGGSFGKVGGSFSKAKLLASNVAVVKPTTPEVAAETKPKKKGFFRGFFSDMAQALDDLIDYIDGEDGASDIVMATPTKLPVAKPASSVKAANVKVVSKAAPPTTTTRAEVELESKAPVTSI